MHVAARVLLAVDHVFKMAEVLPAVGAASTDKVLMNELGIVVSPGNIFGQYGEGYLRFCYAVPEKRIKAAIDRLVGYFN